jgi:hypothetical protein
MRKHHCNLCGEEDPSCFYSTQKQMCKKCRTLSNAARVIQHKKNLVEYKGGKCEICGYSKCVAALEFHHNTGVKNFGICEKLHYSLPHLKSEADLCMLVCANCHPSINPPSVLPISIRFYSRKERMMEELGANGCMECGFSGDIRSIDFHHRDASEKEDIMCDMFRRKWDPEAALREARKCDVLCSNCHMELHYLDGSLSLKEEKHTPTTPKPVLELVCRQCQLPFRTTNPNRICCSVPCRAAYRRSELRPDDLSIILKKVQKSSCLTVSKEYRVSSHTIKKWCDQAQVRIDLIL